uniref:Mitotic spindle organizing protein 1 n=1 Tax=Dicentrarchus labrax TaxID=13489 RepID=A0A8P4GBM7_DICLA
MASAANANLNAVRETMDVLLEISRLLNTGLDMESLSICVRLCEQGINPEALSAVIKELRKASESLKVQTQAPKELTIILSKRLCVEVV